MNDNEEENGDWIPDQVWNDKFGIVETGYRLSSVRRIIGGDYGGWIPCRGTEKSGGLHPHYITIVKINPP